MEAIEDRLLTCSLADAIRDNLFAGQTVEVQICNAAFPQQCYTATIQTGGWLPAVVDEVMADIEEEGDTRRGGRRMRR